MLAKYRRLVKVQEDSERERISEKLKKAGESEVEKSETFGKRKKKKKEKRVRKRKGKKILKRKGQEGEYFFCHSRSQPIERDVESWGIPVSLGSRASSCSGEPHYSRRARPHMRLNIPKIRPEIENRRKEPRLQDQMVHINILTAGIDNLEIIYVSQYIDRGCKS